MEFRKLGSSDLNLSTITFGAWAAGGWMWGSNDRNDAVNAIRASYEEGVTTIDTAPIYGMGVSEEIVQEAISVFSRDKVQILTKFGMRWDLPNPNGDFVMKSQDNYGNPVDIYRYASKESVIYEVENSLKRLKTDYIDLIQLHWPDSTTPISETMEAMERLVEQGKVRAAGVSNYNAQQLTEALKYTNVVSDQVPYSMLNRDIEKDLIPLAIDKNVGIIVYSPLERGLLSGKYLNHLSLQEGDHRIQYFQKFDKDVVAKLIGQLRIIANDHKVTVSQLVLKWTALQKGVTIVLAGARNAQQSVENARAIHLNLSESELNKIGQILQDLHV